jgi:hypothetical protein
VFGRAIVVIPDDLARTVDAECKGAEVGTGPGIVEGGVGAAVGIEDIAVVATGVVILPNDLACIIDAVCVGVADFGQGIVEGRVDIDWHHTGSTVIVAL